MLGLALDPSLVLVLGLVALLSGVGITTVGPGGIFVTITLYSLTPFSSGEIAGTAHVAFVATGLVGTAAYARSGELRTGEGRAVAAILSASSVAGALAGAYANAFVARSLFGLLLGGVAAATGGIILYRELRGLRPAYSLDATTRRGQIALGVLGLLLGMASGLLGIGGPVLAVPVLVLVGVPLLLAVAVAQVQSIFIATFAATGYLLQGVVSPPLAVLITVPLLAGVVGGWKVAHRVDPGRLKVVLGLLLLAVGPFLTL